MESNRKIALLSKAYQPLPHMQPAIRIAPFAPVHFEQLLKTSVRARADQCLQADFWLDGGKDMQFYESGRQAILAALHHQGLGPEDEVVIITTTQGGYISGCVTRTIEKVCRWSRGISPQTRMALVIHEFGFPCLSPQVQLCQKMGIPILEDCAYALGSRERGAAVAHLGDYAIYSLTKHYPTPLGGILVAKDKIKEKKGAPPLESSDRSLVKAVLQRAALRQRSWDAKRRENWNFFRQRLKPFGMKPYFSLAQDVVPGAFVFSLPAGCDGATRKRNLAAAGVESTEYYGMGGFYFPAHQFLTDFEREYILRHFLKT